MSISPITIPQALSVKSNNVIPFKGASAANSEYYYADIARSIDTFEKEMGLRNHDKGFLAFNIVNTPVDTAKRTVQERIETLTNNLYNLVYKDSMLKKVDNKRAYQRDKVKMCIDSCREQKALGYIAFDIDNFGGYNNEFGHAEGDSALAVFADTVQEVLGDKGTLYRIGGEEFAALLPGYNSVEIAEISEKIRAAVEEKTQKKTEESQLPGPFTVSLGYASIEPTKELQSIEELYELSKTCKQAKIEFREKFGKHFGPLEHGADEALYISKLYKGRNSTTDVAELGTDIFNLVLTLGRDIASVMRNSSQNVTERLVPQLEQFANQKGGEQAIGQLALEFGTIMDDSSERVKKELLGKLDQHVMKN